VLGLPVVEGLHAVLDAADADEAIKVVVITSGTAGFFAAEGIVVARSRRSGHPRLSPRRSSRWS
jgi:enoyl-CoA hydratase/carnithine racemase